LIFAWKAKINLAKLETSFSRLAKTRRFRVFVAASLPQIAARREIDGLLAFYVVPLGYGQR
jgi:hypothetical protein